MKSPFPGMDPYLEHHWRDVHAAVIAQARVSLNQILPGDLAARTEERVYVETDDQDRRRISPDVKVVERRMPATPGGPSAAVAEPVILELESEPVSEPYIQIIEPDGGRVVTAIEFLSPSNKRRGPGRDEYQKKRDEFLASDANLIEVDLVRAGDWAEMMRPFFAPADCRTAYRALISRANRRGRIELYPIALNSRLPILPVPLRRSDPDVSLDIQALLDHAYESGRYDGTDYRRPCQPALEESDAAWADQLLRSAGKR